MIYTQKNNQNYFSLGSLAGNKSQDLASSTLMIKYDETKDAFGQTNKQNFNIHLK